MTGANLIASGRVPIAMSILVKFALLPRRSSDA
jgi:hypothetical protein